MVGLSVTFVTHAKNYGASTPQRQRGCVQHQVLEPSCDLELWPPTSKQVISSDQWLFPVSFIEPARSSWDMVFTGLESDSLPAVTLTSDLQNLIRPLVAASEYILSVLSKLFKLSMRYLIHSFIHIRLIKFDMSQTITIREHAKYKHDSRWTNNSKWNI